MRGIAAGLDNLGLFFGEDMFLVFCWILLILGFLDDIGISFYPSGVAVWAFA